MMKKVANFILVDYMKGYKRLDPILDEKIKYINQLQEMYLNAAQKVSDSNKEIEKLSGQMAERVGAVKKKNKEI
jgi:hypothetical protein